MPGTFVRPLFALLALPLLTAAAPPPESQVDMLVAAPDRAKLLLENEHVRVIEYTLKPGERDQWHTHPPKVSYVVTGGTLRITLKDGKSFVAEETAGAASWMDYLGLHYAENIGSTPVKILLVEVKEAANKASAEAPTTARPFLFVCEHGNVKSLISATLFNQRAQSRGLPFRAVSRGVHPESSVPPAIVDALKREQADVATFQPQQLMSRDVNDAARVIAIGVDVSAFTKGTHTPIESWTDVPPASVDYEASRTAMLRHIDALLDQLETQ